ncbi:hypothetical protein [Bradyrhizobium diazoefficiens]|uniref:hypothetical protein n=1 Tax=Bradyrhizobium diazoefficiens TaxID=1355477 RepID=UPI0005770CEA|nr:hypothetical protein [Bradyrhizobium diazoefficiens]
MDDRPGERLSPPLPSVTLRLREMEEHIKSSFVRERIAERRALFDYIGVRFTLDAELPEGWCRFTRRDGLEYSDPLSRMPKDVLAAEMTVATDIWEELRTIPEPA